MPRNKAVDPNALIFIDTNILLDFYRIRKSDISLKYLAEIERHKAIIITSSQVEMEFKKNRQSVILESIGEVKKIISINTSVPALLANALPAKMIVKFKRDLEKQQKKLRARIENVLKRPNVYDPVFKSLQKIFQNKCEINLNRENELRFRIRKLAFKRFFLGYPPRKKNDTSIGDAINWEWIIHCAKTTNKNVIVVTRDTDYGAVYGDDCYLDDWLSKEFRERTNNRSRLILTEKLSKAFELVNIPVTQDMIDEETQLIGLTGNDADKDSDIYDVIKKIGARTDISDVITDSAIKLIKRKWNNLTPKEKK